MQTSEIIDQIKKIGSGVFKTGNDELSESAALEDISGWNSIRHVMFIDTIEKQFNISFTFDEMLELSSIKAIGEKVHQKLG